MKDRTTGGIDDNGSKSYGLEEDRYRDGDDMAGRSDRAEHDRLRDNEISPSSVSDDMPLSDRRYSDDAGSERLGSDSFSRDSGPKPTTTDGDQAPLFSIDDSDRFRARWKEIQTHFVDEPRQSVEEADELVAEVTDRLMSAFTKNRNDLERQWSAGDEVSTENLRQTLQHYRSFFERLLSM